MIVKIQQQIGGNTTPQQMLVYNQNRKYLLETDMTPEVKKLLGDRPKAYFEAQVKNNNFIIGKEVPAQNW